MEKGETMNVNGENDGNDNPWSELEKLSGEWGKFNNVPSGGAWGKPLGEELYKGEMESEPSTAESGEEVSEEVQPSFAEMTRKKLEEMFQNVERTQKEQEAEEVARKAAEEERAAEAERKNERRELGKIVEEMARGRERIERENNDYLKRQRVQEIVERDLNSRILKVDDLETEVLSENPEVDKRFVSWRKQDIPVYDLKGLPFAMLSTTVDYRKLGKEGDIGTETYKTIMKNPWTWTGRRDEAEGRKGFGTREANARGDTISASYWNSERNIGSHVHGDLIYGFEGVDADSIILVANGDGGTNNMAGNLRTTLQDADEVKRLEGATGAATYNEVLLRRYSENGIPKRPDYLIVEDGKITEDVLRHAKYYDIPIINVENSFYQEKARKRGEELMDSISESDSYEELSGKLEELLSMPMYQRDYNMLKYIGRKGDEDQFLHSTPLRERLSEISKMEMMKRLDYLKNAIESATRKLEENTKNGVRVSRDQLFPDFKGISVGFGRNNELMILGGLKDRSLSMDTWIFDEEGDYYSTLEPVVRRFLEADQENWKAVGQ